ncbi:MAG: glycosyltransferase family 4 protein [Candidatus Pacebacteria bacterium]|nr:glycosyltransferase family 4 protein [Candidatus Paceibacterota bacterium]
MLKVLMLSSDRNIFKENSPARKRMAEYGKIFEELHIVVLNKRKVGSPGEKHQSLGNVFLHPTNSPGRWFFVFDAIVTGAGIIRGWKLGVDECAITSQDPFEMGLAGYLLKRKFNLPLQLQVHTDFLSPFFRRESFLNKIRVLLAKFLLPRADGIRVVSERIKKSLEALDAENKMPEITVLPIFVDIEKIRAEEKSVNLHEKYHGHDFIILMASRLTREKNVGAAIEAFDKIRHGAFSVSKPLLLIVGEGPEMKNLQLITHNLQLERDVVFEPWTEDLIPYYKSADLFLMTSNYEGYGLAAVEALAADLPVIMTDVGVAGEVIIDGSSGMVASSDNLGDKIVEFLRDRRVAEKFRQNSRKLFGKFPTMEKYLRLYRESLEKLLLLK